MTNNDLFLVFIKVKIYATLYYFASKFSHPLTVALSVVANAS